MTGSTDDSAGPRDAEPRDAEPRAARPPQDASLPAAVVFPDNPAALAISRELGAAGVPVILAHPHRDGPAAQSRFTRHERVPDLYRDTGAWAEALGRLGRSLERPALLFPTEDAALLACERHHEELERVFRLAYPAPGVVGAIADKRRLYAVAERAGIAVPRHRELASAEDADGLGAGPWLVKPPCRYALDGAGVRTFLAATGGPKAIGGGPREAARRVLEAGFPALAQEEIAGGFHELISFGLCLGRDGELIDGFAARKDCEYPEPYGDGLIVERVADPGLMHEAVRLLREFGYWGICDVEFKRDPRDGRFKLLDANPRAWLWMTLGTLNGHSLAVHAYNQAIRTDPESAGLEARAVAVRSPLRRWVSARGTAGFLTRCYRPGRHGLLLPLRLLAGTAATSAANLRTFRDPLYARPAAWRALTRTLRGSSG